MSTTAADKREYNMFTYVCVYNTYTRTMYIVSTFYTPADLIGMRVYASCFRLFRLGQRTKHVFVASKLGFDVFSAFGRRIRIRTLTTFAIFSRHRGSIVVTGRPLLLSLSRYRGQDRRPYGGGR